MTAGAVVSEHIIASSFGAAILEAGGSAVDAAVATTLAVGVLCPYHSCIGGGGFALIRTPDDAEVLDFRHVAPSALTMEHFTETGASTSHGGLAVAVPGHLRGLHTMHARYGKLGWCDVVLPAAKMAREGMPMLRDLYDFLQLECPNAPSIDGSWMASDPEFVRTFTRDGRLVQVGAMWSRPEYAAVLERVADEGPDAFYTGDVADAVVRTVCERGGVMTVEDLKNYSPIWRAPLSATYRGYTILTTPAPASGAAMLCALGILEHFDMPGPPTATSDAHRTAEALRFAYGARTQLGDPGFVDCAAAQDDMVSREGAEKRAKRVEENTHNPKEYIPSMTTTTDSGTSNITAADESGLVVSLTTTIGLIWASRIMVPGTGIMLNDSIDDFSVEGRSNGTGYAPAPPNYVMGNKRPLSSSCPYIVLRDGQPVLAGGSAGGSTIISANVQALRNMIDYGMTAAEALAAPRLHDQVLPNVTVLERASDRGQHVQGWSEDEAKGLRERGHEVEWIAINRSTPVAMRILPGPEWDVAGDARKWEAGGAVCGG